MIAHLGMYVRADANATFWAGIRNALGYGPETLSSARDYWRVWQHPDLLFSQTCGYPYRARLHGQVQLIGTPDYGVAECPVGYYRSVFVKRRDYPRQDLWDFAGARFAYNEPLSQSGWAAPVTKMLEEGAVPGTLLRTGGHALSARAVAEETADYAALDAVTWSLIESYDPDLAQRLVPFAETEPTPGLPFITGPKSDPEALAAAVALAIDRLPTPTREQLRLRGFVQIPAEAYLAISSPPDPATLMATYGASSGNR